MIKETYRHYAGISMVNGVPAIGINVLSEFLQATNIPDSKYLKLSDIDVEFISTNVASKDVGKLKQMNPERHLCRFEFMEILVRFAL